MSEKIQPVLVAVATLGMIVFNYLAVSEILGGLSPGEVSVRYPTAITPAGFAFTIWTLIYFGCIAFSIYQFSPSVSEKIKKLRRPYIVSCVLNCVWLYVWNQEMILAGLGVIFLLLLTLVFINFRLRTTETQADYWFAKFPFGIYFGWVTAATLVNAMIALIFVGLPLGYEVYLGAIFVFVASALGVLVRISLTNYFYPLAIAWALTAIAVKQSGKTLIVVTCAVGVVACLLAAISFVMNMPSSENKAESSI